MRPQAGQPFPKAAQLSTRLITEAKRTAERSWLGEVSAVVLQQSLRDADLDRLLASFDTDHGDHDTARGALVDFYLSAEHRDQPGTGCPTAGFAGDMAREPTAGEVRETYAAGVEEFAAWMSTDAADGLPVVATLIGAILLARATAGTERSWSRPTKP